MVLRIPRRSTGTRGSGANFRPIGRKFRNGGSGPAALAVLDRSGIDAIQTSPEIARDAIAVSSAPLAVAMPGA